MSLHENLDRKTQVRLAAERDLGLVFAAFFILVSLAPLRHGQPLRGWALLLSAGFLVVTAWRPMWLRPLNRLWSKLGFVMGQVTTPIITTLLFLVVVVPLGFILRLLGKDPLRLSFDRAASTYWIERNPPGPAADSMSNQF